MKLHPISEYRVGNLFADSNEISIDESRKNNHINLRHLKEEVRRFERNTGQVLTLKNYLNNFGLDIRTIFKTAGSWARLKKLAGRDVSTFNENSKYTKFLEGGLSRLYHTNSYDYLQFLQLLLNNEFCVNIKSERDRKFINLFYYTVWRNPINTVNDEYTKSFTSIEDAIASLKEEAWIIEELQTLIDIRLKSLKQPTRWFEVVKGSEIELYGCYSADEIHLLLENRLRRGQSQGTQYDYVHNLAMVFVTLNKPDKEYSPSTRYQDYVISQCQFHWQSMYTIRKSDKAGQRIINQKRNGWKYILFVRESRRDEYGNTNGYYCLGTMDFNSSYGECPMNVVWDMHEPIPDFILEASKAV